MKGGVNMYTTGFTRLEEVPEKGGMIPFGTEFPEAGENGFATRSSR